MPLNSKHFLRPILGDHYAAQIVRELIAREIIETDGHYEPIVNGFAGVSMPLGPFAARGRER